MEHYDFDELNNAADISLLQGIPQLHPVRTAAGTELHGPCPFGNPAIDEDGFYIKTYEQPMLWFCRGRCSGCSHGGDPMQYIAQREHLNRKPTLEEIEKKKEDPDFEMEVEKIARILAAEIGAAPSSFCNVPGKRPAAAIRSKPRILTPPPQQWQDIAGRIVEQAAAKLHDDTDPEALEALDYLHSRGITNTVIDRYKIGYIPIIPKYFSYKVDPETGNRIYRKTGKDEKVIKVPEGITIPVYLEGQLYRVKIRTLNRRAKDQAAVWDQWEPDKAPHKEHDFRYKYISGIPKGTDTGLFNGDEVLDMHPRRDILFVEGEMDALLINSIMQPAECDQLQAVTFGSASKNPAFETYYQYFRTPERIVIVYDNDQAGQDGAAFLQSEIMKLATRETPPITKTIPEVNGKQCKDFGDYYQAGGSIYDLITSWFPL